MEKRYLLGVDVGTSAMKLALFSLEGKNRPVATHTESYATDYPQNGYAEQHPEAWWQAMTKGIPALLQKAREASPLPVTAGEIAAVGIDGQSWAAVIIDSKGEVLAPAPLWFDTRAGEICREMKETYGEERLFSVSMNPVAPGYTFPKILWFKKHAPDIYRRTATVLGSDGFLVYRLTGRLSCNLSQGYGYTPFDLAHGTWNEALCEELGVDASLLPPLYPCHAVVGEVTSSAALQCGLAAGTPVVAGGLDAACEALGAGVIHAGEVQEQGGQAGGMSICTDLPTPEKNLILGHHVVEGQFLLQGGTVGGGAILRWFDGALGRGLRAEAKEKGVSPFALADTLAAEVPAGAEGLLLLPYFAGERSPIWEPRAKAVYYGMDYGKTEAHFLRANLEGAAFALRHNLETAKQSGATVGALRATGGAAKSPVWCQIKADVTGHPVEVPHSVAGAAYGAAVLAGVGTGLIPDFDSVAADVTVAHTYYPSEKNKAVYDEAYNTYLALYRALAPLMRGTERKETT